MTAPQNIQPVPGASDSGVAAFDTAGDLTIAGNLVMKNGAVVLGKVSAAPTPVPGAVQLYTTDGTTVAMVGAGGVPANQTIAGTLTVNGAETVNGIVSITSAQVTSGLLVLTNTVENSSDGTIHFEMFDTASRAIGIRVAGESQQHYVMTSDGGMAWGAGGASARDTFMSRSAAGVLTMPGANTASVAAVLTPTFANNTAAQLTDLTRDYMVYMQVGTAGTATTLAIGPTSTPANTIKASSAANAGDLWSFRLPAGWFVKWAGTTTTIATQTAIGC